MNVVAAQSGSGSGATAASRVGMLHDAAAQPTRHPCVRVWGACLHGETCLFRNAPYDLCIAYLMGLCRHHRTSSSAHPSASDGTAVVAPSTSCTLLHQHIYDLPNVSDPAPAVRYAGDVDDEASAWGQWLQRRRGSLNSAEWQLWHNGPPHALLDHFVPLTPSPTPPAAVAAGARAADEPVVTADGDDDETADVPLNLTDIMSALAQVKRGSGSAQP